MTFSEYPHRAGLLLAALIFGAGQVAVAQSAASLRVQGAQQANFSRVIIDLPEGVPYAVEKRGTQLFVTLTGTFNVDFSGLSTSDLRQISSPSQSGANGRTVLAFGVPNDANARDFRSGRYLVLDVYSDNTAPNYVPRATAADATVGTQTAPETVAAATPQADNTANPPADAGTAAPAGDGGANQATNGTPANTQNPAATPPATPQADTGQPAANQAAGTEAKTPLPGSGEGAGNREASNLARLEEQAVVTNGGAASGSSASGTTDIAARPANATNGSLKVSGEGVPGAEDKVISATVEAIDAGIALTFPWPEEVAAAVFERGGYEWIVFDKAYVFDTQSLVAAGTLVTQRIRSLDVRSNADALILRLNVRSNQSAVAERRGTTWVVSLKDTTAKPRFPLAPDRQADASQGQQIFIPATDIGRKIEVEDPAVGDMMVVLPMLREGRGMAQPYNYAAANILETAQGVVVVPLSDSVNVERFREGIAIRSSGNGVLSATSLNRGTGPGNRGGGNREGMTRLIDFAAWRQGPPWEYRKNKAEILYELSLRPANDRNDVRWKLARYFLAHGRAAECLGMLERMLTEEPLLVQNSEYLAVRGVANFKQGRLKAAEKDLATKELEVEQDAELWRALVAEAQGHYEEALEHYRRGKDVMGTYDDMDRAEIQLAAVRAGIETGDIELAQRELELLNGLDLSEAQLSESVYQSARIAERQGQMDAALVQYDDLSDVPQRWIAARARYSRIKFGLKTGDLNPTDAIDQLERLRYAWRGDRFEVQLIDDLSNLYFDTKQYESGLLLLKQALSYYPEEAAERQMSSRMGKVFRDIFLGDEAEKMTPLAAISLFYNFRELTPLGADGDLMVRRLSERLVSVDLLDRAAELLEYQVKVRTEGAARAQIAARLAKIYILDQQPERALEILRATREPRLPEDIDANRRWVEARALTEMQRYEEAEVMLEGDTSPEADTLRADIFWGGKNWSKLASTVRGLLGDGWRRNEPVTALQRLNLIRLTIALTFMEDRSGLIEMRRRYGQQMRNGDFANAFDLLTNDQELSGRELGKIAGQIANVEKLQSFMRDYRSDFSGR